ncbi:MAG: HAD family hydrolase [Planctomycetes bacterium]|jgi:D-glycero-D-manno-heptose 1,7-bisphosphate phosphatase|nr:HAD family hydrolase [Planctomycetota bacterium]
MSHAAVFFDRDGTLIHDPGYLNHPDQVRLLEGAAEALKEFQLLGYKTVVASNQSGVARGVVTIEMLERIHDRLRELLAAKGASLDAVYYCPDHPEGVVPEYAKDSDWRKPQPGMLLAAAAQMDLDLTRSWMIGNSDRDIEAGRRAGCQTILIRARSTEHAVPPGTRPAAQPQAGRPDHIAVNLREAVNIIKRHHRSVPERSAAPAPGTGAESTLAITSAGILSLTGGLDADPRREDSPAAAPLPAPVSSRTDELLGDILEQLRRMQKREMFGEFSLMRLLAGILQVFVPFCLLLALWFLMGARRQDDSILLALAFAAVLQLMALTFYIMQGRR